MPDAIAAPGTLHQVCINKVCDYSSKSSSPKSRVRDRLVIMVSHDKLISRFHRDRPTDTFQKYQLWNLMMSLRTAEQICELLLFLVQNIFFS